MNDLIICMECNGTGKICEDVGSHKSEYMYSQCTKCKGSGRLIETKYLSTFEPFVPDENTAQILF